jgi:uncharacterized protein
MAKATKPACSFCDRPASRQHTTLWRHGSTLRAGPNICETCVMQALSILQEEVEESRCDVYVSTSPVHGRGVFAGQRIKKGTYVGTYEGHDNGDVTWNNSRYVIYHYDDTVEEPTSWRIGTNEFRFLNHSDDPNLEMDEDYHFWARRTIKKDEELTWYYGEEFAQEVSQKRRRGRGVGS